MINPTQLQETQEDLFAQQEQESTQPPVEGNPLEGAEEQGMLPEEESFEQGDDLFGAVDEDVENGAGEEEPTENSSVVAFNYLKEKGLINVELEEGEELTEAKATELIEESFDKSVDEGISEVLQELPEEVKQLNKYILDGGSLGEYLNIISQGGSVDLIDNVDLEDESNQERVAKQLLVLEGLDEEDVELQLEFLKEKGRLKSFAEKKLSNHKEKIKKDEEQLIEQQKLSKEQLKQQSKEEKKKFEDFVNKAENVGELRLSQKDKKEIPSYVNDKKVKISNGATITALQKDLFYDLPKNNEAYTQLAILMKNRNEDGTFNFSSIVNNAKTEVSKDIKQNIRRASDIAPNKSSGVTNSPNKSLADYF